MTLQTWLDQTPTRWRPAAARAMNLFPPLLSAGIHIRHVAADLHAFDVELRALPWNRDVDGLHFGGSIYAMCDPFFHVSLATQLGPGYQIWDKSAQIEFKRPGRGTLRARFSVPPDAVRAIRREIARAGKHEATFSAEVLGPAGEIVAIVHKTLWLRKLPRRQHGDGHDQPTA